MEEEILELREEVELLTRKVELLEKKENHRKAYAYLKILGKVLLTLAISYGVYWGYKYVVDELPNIIVNKVKEANPLNGLLKK